MIYIDMDGCTSDYDGNVKLLTGKSIEELKAMDKWLDFKKKLPEIGHFSMLDPLPLCAILRRYPGKFEILTAIGTNEPEKVRKQKEHWLTMVFRENLPVAHFVSKSKDKAAFAKSFDDLLIDDRDVSIIPFANAGGSILKFANTPGQLKFIEEIFKNA